MVGMIDRFLQGLSDRLNTVPREVSQAPLSDGEVIWLRPSKEKLSDAPLRLTAAVQARCERTNSALKVTATGADARLLLRVSPPSRAGHPGENVGPALFWVEFLDEEVSGPLPSVRLCRGKDAQPEALVLQSQDSNICSVFIPGGRPITALWLHCAWGDGERLINRIGLTLSDRGAEALGRAALDNVYLLSTKAIEREPDGRTLIFTDDDPQIEFSLESNIKTGDFLRLHYKAKILEGENSLVKIYCDYGDGYNEDNSFFVKPTEGGEAILFAPYPENITRIRFDPSEHVGRIVFLGLDARSADRAELCAFLGMEDALRPLQPLLGAIPSSLMKHFLWLLAVAVSSGDDNKVIENFLTSDILANYLLDPSSSACRTALLDYNATLHQPLISVLMPVYNAPLDMLKAAIDSVRAQVYPRWELCVADDASPDPAIAPLLRDYAALDARIKVIFRERNGHISQASNSALDLVTGEWVALLDHDDLLTPDALYWVAATVTAHPETELIYSDEDKLAMDGTLLDPFYKPDFSPALLTAQNYFNHLTVHRTENIRAVGGWRSAFDGSQDYDLTLRIIERIPSSAIRHIPRILYHWRLAPGSTAAAASEKNYAYIAGLRALEEHLIRRGAAAHVEKVPGYFYYRVRHELPTPKPLVSLIIPTRDSVDILEICVRSILEKTEYDDFEIIIVDNGSVQAATKAFFEDIVREDNRVRVIPYDAPFNYSAINNFAAARARGELFGLVNNDIEVINSDWLTEMVAWALLPDVGCVGAKLYYPNETIQHAGVILGIGGIAGHSHKYFDRNNPGYFARLVLHQDVSAVTAACLLVRRKVYEQVGGLDDGNLPVAFNDVDFCLRVREAGFRNIFTPFAELYHHESVSRGAEDTPEKKKRFKKEVDYMRQRWGAALTRDPYYSPNLTLEHENFSAKVVIKRSLAVTY
jgi:glycosyltransferase involved in cell wall biosynthesis